MDFRLFAPIICAAIPTILGFGPETYRCPASVTVNKFVRTHGDYCYQFLQSEKTWYGANDDCRTRGGQLVTIQRRSIQNFLMRSFREFHWPSNGVWIGTHDRQTEMDWRWVTRERVSAGYSNWASGQPSCYFFACIEDCGQMRLDEGGKWHDYKCDFIEPYSYVCQYKLSPKTTIATTTPTTTTTTTTKPSTTTATSTLSTTTATAARNSTVNDTGVVLERMVPNVKVELLGAGNVADTKMSKLEHSEESEASPGLVVVLALGLICGLFLGLCIGVFFFRRKNRKNKEEVPDVFFSNPYYADARTPLNGPPPPPPDYDIDDTICSGGGGVSLSQAPTPVKRPICGPPLPKRRVENIYNPTPTLGKVDCRGDAAAAGDHYDEITTQKMLFAAEQEQGAVGGREFGEEDLVDNHYDYATGENYYETVDNVRLAIAQNALNELQEEEERYVPFALDSPAPPPELK